MVAVITSEIAIKKLSRMVGNFDYIGLSLIPLLFTLGAVLLLWKFMERKPLSSFGFAFRNIGRDISLAILLPILIMGSTFAILVLSGQIQIVSFNFDVWKLLYFIVVLMFYAAIEELPLRGYLQRILLESIHPMWTVVWISILFGLMHISNQYFSVVELLNCMILGGMIGIYFVKKKNLWFPIVFHLSWNYFMGIFFGSSISGKSFGYSLLTIQSTGNELLTGGIVGFEGSLILLVISSISLVFIYRKYKIN